MTKKYILYFDDTGSRDPDKYYNAERRDDKMDCFGLGGVLVKEEDVNSILKMYEVFCAKWDINYPLHSTDIRGGRRKFAWLKKPENAGEFLPSLQDFLLSLPIIGIACIIDRPGYVDKYKDRYNDSLWYMCKSAFCILVERAAKFSDDRGRQLEIFFERAGKKEDRDIKGYIRELKRDGNIFNSQTSKKYTPFSSEDYKRVILGEPREKTKKFAMMQIADLVLYPIAKGGYDPDYRSYKALKEADKLIDSHLPEDKIASCGIKYSCFNIIKD
ncbi:MAG: DUF3800 domain-containing protein [Burkholderiales bacterium]|nr:DUF3800 domain-containing protein [Burkholderiales bacterium]